jgi:hypothetical protein
MAQIIKVIGIALTYLLLLPAIASADSPIRPRSYSINTPDGKFVFVMIAPVSAEDDGSFTNPDGKAESQRVRAKYSVSGLYRNDGSTTPLWTVDWFAHFVLVASDGRHLIRRGYWTLSMSDEALTFFAEGRKINSVKVGDLFYTSHSLPKRMDQLLWHESTELDERKRRLILITTLRDRYEFDYTTGEMISTRSPVRALLVVIVFLVGAILVFYARRWRGSKRAV